ncbi:hypothetical protein DL93DRAFT_1531686 [Clavulina sp. PMI_390]|nr:hypothetical protein DL93DRAFT_1531686 [Clavulina sp. PMI_390]
MVLMPLFLIFIVVFKQSTFETDSLAHTLELLRGMDSHGFTLLTTVCLGKRSRVQDFWIFSAPAPPQPPTSPSIGLPLAAMPSIRKVKDGDVQGSPVQSHSMLGLGNADVPSAIKRGAQPPMPSPAVNPAVQAAIASSSGHTRSASNPTAGPRSSHIRTSSLPGAQHVLRKTPPPGASKERIPPLDSTPRASPRERARNLQPSPLPGQRGPSPSPPQQNIPQAYPVMPTSSVASSNQFIYMASPPPSGPEPIYNTVPSGTFALPPQAGGIERVGPSGHSRSATQGTHDPRQDEYDRLAEDGEEDEDEEEEHEQEDEYHETPPLLGAGVFRDTVGTSVNFGDTLTQYSEDESFSDEGRTREGDLERAAAAAAYLGAVGVADFSGANENDARRDVARPRDSLASEESRATIVYQKDADAQGATPRLVRADLLPDSDPARRASNSLSISYAGSHSVAPSSFSPSQTGVPPFLDPGNRTVSDATTHYLPGAWVTDPNTPTEFDNQRHDYGPPEDLRTPGDEASEIGLDVSDLAPSAATTPGVELDRLTTRAAAAEVVSWSNSAQRHQQQVGMGMDDGNGIGPSLSRANSGLSDVTMDSMASTADGNTALHEPQLVVRVSDESSRDGPWALVNDHANTTSIVEVEPPVPSNPPNTEASPPPAPSVASPLPATTTPAAPAAVPTPIPAIGDQSAFVKTKKGAFPWSKSRREAREREKALEREKFRAKVDEARKKSTSTAPAAGTSSSGVPAPAITSNVNTSPVEVKNSSLTPVQPEGPSNTSSMVVETGTSTSSSSSSSASTDSSSSSTLPTPTHNSPDVPAVATVSHGREASDGSSPARLRTARKPSGIPEVTVADRRLTID